MDRASSGHLQNESHISILPGRYHQNVEYCTGRMYHPRLQPFQCSTELRKWQNECDSSHDDNDDNEDNDDTDTTDLFPSNSLTPSSHFQY